MVALPFGKQRSIHGPAVNVPAKVDTICSVLPRLPSQTELIPLKQKRKLAYKGHYMYDYVTPQKVMFSDVEINDEWIEQSISNNKELYTSLVEHDDENEMDTLCELPTQQVEGDDSANRQPGNVACVNKL